jgi:hypothetical protein
MVHHRVAGQLQHGQGSLEFRFSVQARQGELTYESCFTYIAKVEQQSVYELELLFKNYRAC